METTDFRNYLTDDIRIIAAFTAFFILAMLCWAYAIVLTKRINANCYQINLILGLVVQLTGAVTYPYTTNQSTYETLSLAILFTGIPLTIAQTLFIAALRMSKNTGMVSIMGFSAVVVSYFINIFRYNEKPNIVTTVGVVLVLFGLWRTIFGKTRD